jgi:hypothetical protein
MNTQMLSRVALALALVSTACASATKRTDTDAVGQSSSSLLTTEEIMKTGQPTAYRVIQTLRPQWLLVRRMGSSSGRVETIKVYVQGNRYGEVAALESLLSSTIKEIRHMDARDATTRYGTGHGSGAILVTLR